MKNKWTRLLLIGIAMFSLTLSACGGGGSGGGTTGGTTSPVYMTGQFIDSAVSGLIYKCSSGDSGITKTALEGTLGEFSCQVGDTVEFFVGDYSIGSATAKKYITPYDLYPGNDAAAIAAAIDVARLLMTLDSDGDPSNGITIPGVLPANLSTITDRPGDPGFATAMATALGEALIGATEAQNHLEGSYADLLSTWDYHFDIGKPFYSVFFEDNEWKIVTVELTSESAVKATFEGTTYNGTWAVIDDEAYGEILNIAVSGQDPGYYTLLVVEENRLNVCYADYLSEMDVCDDREYFYFNFADAQAHNEITDTDSYYYIQSRTFETMDYPLTAVYASLASGLDFDDIQSIQLMNSAGQAVLQTADFFQNTDQVNRYTCNAGCTLKRQIDKYFFASTDRISGSGNFTFKIVTHAGEIFTEEVYYPGIITIPYINSSTITVQRNIDDSISVNWSNPNTQTNWNYVEQIRVIIAPQVAGSNKSFSVILNATTEAVTIPAKVVNAVYSSEEQETLQLRILTRAHTDAGHNYARGHSATRPLFGSSGGGDSSGPPPVAPGPNLFLDHLAIGVPFYNVFFEGGEWKIITVELTSNTALNATFEGNTYTGTWVIIDDDIVNITVTGQDPGYYKLLGVEEKRLNVCYLDSLNSAEMKICDEFFYFNLADAQAHGEGNTDHSINVIWNYRYVDEGYSNYTNLLWQKDDDGITRNWQEATDYCNNLTLAGNSNWRLPNFYELGSLINTSYSPTIDPIFSSTKSEFYWSASTLDGLNPELAQTVNFYNGDDKWSYNKANFYYYVRCVR